MSLGLDNPVWSSLVGHHRHLAIVHGAAARYPDDVSMFCAVDPVAADPWPDLAALVGSQGIAGLAGGQPPPASSGFSELFHEAGFRFLLHVEPKHDGHDGIVELGPADRQAMFDLVQVAQPGPYAMRTPALGTYLGIRQEGVLVAMAGERMHPTGGTEISAVATHPDARRQGLAAALTAELARRIQARGELPFLHTMRENVSAQRVYEALGFERAGELHFRAVQAPA